MRTREIDEYNSNTMIIRILSRTQEYKNNIMKTKTGKQRYKENRKRGYDKLLKFKSKIKQEN